MSRILVDQIRSNSASADAMTLDGSGNVTFPANVTCSGTATGMGGGKLLQIKQIVKKDVVSYSVDAGSFGNTDSTFSLSITPSSTSSLILLGGFMNLAVSGQVSNVSIVYRRDGATISTAVNSSGTATPIGEASGSRKQVTSSGNNSEYGYYYNFSQFYGKEAVAGNGVILPAYEPSIFELKYPNQNIKGIVR